MRALGWACTSVLEFVRGKQSWGPLLGHMRRREHIDCLPAQDKLPSVVTVRIYSIPFSPSVSQGFPLYLVRRMILTVPVFYHCSP